MSLKKIKNILYYLLLLSIVGLSLFAVINKNTGLGNYRWFSVLTNSMASGKKDGFYQGDVIIVKKIPDKDISKGDIISFQLGESSVLTHRVVDIQKDENNKAVFITQGDINNSTDPPVSADRVIGKYVFKIPKLGKFIDYLKKWYISVPTILSFYAFIKLIKYYFFNKGEHIHGGQSKTTAKTKKKKNSRSKVKKKKNSRSKVKKKKNSRSKVKKKKNSRSKVEKKKNSHKRKENTEDRYNKKRKRK